MRRRAFLGQATAAGGLGLLAACAPGSDAPEPGTATGPAAGEVDKDVAALGEVTLTVWDQEVRGAQNDAITALIESFESTYPNVTVERVSQAFDDLRQQTALALSGNDVPDVLQVNNARADMGEFVKAGQLTDLSGYAEAYGWLDRFPASVLSKARYSADAVTFGDGSLWGLPQTGEVVGIYYSAAKLQKIGGEAPTTWEELIALVAAAQAAGEQPMVLGNIEGWPALHVFGPLQAASVPVEEIVALGMGNAGADWTSEGNIQALTQMAEWGASGAFGDSPNGQDYDAAWAAFTEGTGVLLIGGSWLGPDMEKAMGEDLHFMAPPPGLDGALATTGGTGLPFTIPAKAKNPVAAAAYIDHITSEEAMQLIAEHGGMPVLDTAQLAPASGVNKEIYEAFDTVSTSGTLLPYLDYATPTFADTAADTLQGVIGGQLEPAAAADALQADYGEFTAAS